MSTIVPSTAIVSEPNAPNSACELWCAFAAGAWSAQAAAIRVASAAPRIDSSLLILRPLFPDETARVAADLGLAAFRHVGGHLPKSREAVDGDSARAGIFRGLKALDLDLRQEANRVRRAGQRSIVGARPARAADPAVLGGLVRETQRDRRARGRGVDR